MLLASIYFSYILLHSSTLSYTRVFMWKETLTTCCKLRLEISTIKRGLWSLETLGWKEIHIQRTFLSQDALRRWIPGRPDDEIQPSTDRDTLTLCKSYTFRWVWGNLEMFDILPKFCSGRRQVNIFTRPVGVPSHRANLPCVIFARKSVMNGVVRQKFYLCKLFNSSRNGNETKTNNQPAHASSQNINETLVMVYWAQNANAGVTWYRVGELLAGSYQDMGIVILCEAPSY